MWEALGNPANPANTLPGGTYNSAGGKPPELSWKDAFSFSREGMNYHWYQAPCARDSLLVGMGTGGAIGGLRFILKGGTLLMRRGP
jgi:cytochrome c oxidase assembly protein subunit 20